MRVTKKFVDAKSIVLLQASAWPDLYSSRRRPLVLYTARHEPHRPGACFTTGSARQASLRSNARCVGGTVYKVVVRRKSRSDVHAAS
jgi:hypothetical protein